ncbi:MAG: hypothetical protein JNM39_14420 [Bdellovibrionaceae bacterium]|nr:hypothetical protein [Pseudobdellovibrionaceae bacterium]
MRIIFFTMAFAIGSLSLAQGNISLDQAKEKYIKVINDSYIELADLLRSNEQDHCIAAITVHSNIVGLHSLISDQAAVDLLIKSQVNPTVTPDKLKELVEKCIKSEQE